jgi:hypothetical protein
MSSHLTWADVSHYYGRNDTVPDVYVASKGKWYPYTSPYPFNNPGHDHLPDLLDLADITEEDAREAWRLSVGSEWVGDGGASCREYMLHHGIDQDRYWHPKEFYYLISRNYNMFWVPTYGPATRGEVQP